MAISGLDMAFWDTLGHAAGWRVVKLLGASSAIGWMRRLTWRQPR